MAAKSKKVEKNTVNLEDLFATTQFDETRSLKTKKTRSTRSKKAKNATKHLDLQTVKMETKEVEQFNQSNFNVPTKRMETQKKTFDDTPNYTTRLFNNDQPTQNITKASSNTGTLNLQTKKLNSSSVYNETVKKDTVNLTRNYDASTKKRNFNTIYLQNDIDDDDWLPPKKKTADNRAIKIKLANLTTTNPKDMCIKARMSKETIDLSRYFDFQTIMNFFTNHSEPLIFNSNNMNVSDVEYYLRNARSPGDFLACLQSNEIPISENKKNELFKRFEITKEKIIQNVANKSYDQKRKFDSIIRKHKSIIDNTGIFSLYIATQFLVGTTKNGTLLNSPIILFPVELINNQGTYTVKHVKNRFVVNEKLLTLLKKEYSLDWVISDIAKMKSLKEIIEVIQKGLNGPVMIASHPNHEFKEFNQIEHPNTYAFNVYDSALLGIYEPIGGALKDNLEKLVELNVDPFVSQNEYSDTKFINQEINGDPLIEIGRPLNIYQKYAVRSALAQNTLIYGPPGTGKSEVIANIIANAIVNLKTVLVVSEKKAALKVLHDRLQDISNLALFIYDLDDKTTFYNKITAIGNKILNMRYDEDKNVVFDLKSKIESSSKWQKVINSHKDVRAYINALIKLNSTKDSLGTSFYEYIKANSNVDKKLLKYAKDSNIISYIEKTMAKYSFKSTENFFNKFNEYKEFLLINGINESNITETLKEQKLIVTKYQVNENLLQYLIESDKEIKKDVSQLSNFLMEAKLDNNETFAKVLGSNPNLLRIQRMKMIEFMNTYPDLYKTGFIRFLIENYDYLAIFLEKYAQCDDKTKPILLNNFLYYKKISKVKPLFKDVMTVTDIASKLSAIKFWSAVPHGRYPYILKLAHDDHKFIGKNTVIVYLNPWMTKPYVKDLGTKCLTFFDEEDVTKLTPVREMDATTFDNFKLIINFEKEIMSNYQELMHVDVNQLINDDRDVIAQVTSNASKDVESYYLEYLKTVLSQLSEAEWNKMQEVFSIARRSSKKNVSIKDYIQKYHKQLSIIFPIWISLPELVAQILPLENAIFKYGIFDEASQMFVERAYPIVYRCETSIVAGDDKQLKPTSFFASRINENEYEYELADNDQVDSLLDRAKVSLWASYNLRNHYRSDHRDLIQFSNDYVYENKLHFATKNGVNKAGIEIINVDGQAEDSVNEKEASVVMDVLEKNINKYNKIIVITFGSKQSLFIEQMIFRMADSQSQIYKKFFTNNLIITNLENVQGNEADLVILSTTFGKNKEGQFKNAYGPLIMDGGINRLNVAITRAKEKMIVVKSIKATDMNINHNNHNALVLKYFFEYCDKFLTNKNSNYIYENKNFSYTDSIFKVEIGNWLLSNMYTKKDIEVVDNYDIGSKIIDFAIVNKKTKKVELALVINKWSNTLTLKDYLESIDNYFFFVDRGYNTIRIEEYAWVYNSEDIKRKILKAINQIETRDFFELEE